MPSSHVIDHNYRPYPQIVNPQSLKKYNKHISFQKFEILVDLPEKLPVVAGLGTAGMRRDKT